ncbi:hypothetical protein [Desulfovirgula thermocuniculi]|uniref:hypothetical protein n=1 Tax=Desulfovirgula thermocuniculi TaxID=348842 RepID=UPI0004033AD1|nr:hypothetical protein [Desulfovirgula thermocuniculi]
MSQEERFKGGQLEKLLFSLLDYQSQNGVDQLDTMLMLGLLNLLGIVSLMNRQAGGTAALPQGAAAAHPMMHALMQVLGGPPPAAQGEKPPSPDPGLLLNMLGNLVAQGPRRQPAPPGAGEKRAAAGNVLKWGEQLEKEKRA